MKRVAFFLALSSIIILSGCGKEIRGTGTAGSTSCPMVFPKAGLCAKIDWIAGPTVGSDSTYQITFWQKEGGAETSPFIPPTAEVGSLLRMTCCGSVHFPTVKKSSTGKFTVTEAKFMTGNWEVYVQLKHGGDVEKQFVNVSL